MIFSPNSFPGALPVVNTLRRSTAARAGFSLVEITLALGVLSFALIPLFSLLPLGMQVFREAIDTTVRTQIVQTITNLAEQTNFSDLSKEKDGNRVATKLEEELLTAAARAASQPVYFYFDDEGLQVPEAAQAVYTVAVSYWVPPPAGIANLPVGATSASFATLWMDVYNNHGVVVKGVPTGKAQTYVLHLADYGKRL
jgi:uncharacterized protein (TIGR02598 family)